MFLFFKMQAYIMYHTTSTLENQCYQPGRNQEIMKKNWKNKNNLLVTLSVEQF